MKLKTSVDSLHLGIFVMDLIYVMYARLFHEDIHCPLKWINTLSVTDGLTKEKSHSITGNPKDSWRPNTVFQAARQLTSISQLLLNSVQTVLQTIRCQLKSEVNCKTVLVSCWHQYCHLCCVYDFGKYYQRRKANLPLFDMFFK